MRKSAAQSFADAASALVEDHDVTDILVRLLRDCADLVTASATAVLVVGEGGELELLSATSHGAAEIELYQIQQDEGPCVEAIRTSAPVSALTTAELRRRWPTVGRGMASAGHHSAYASPLRFRGQVIGALNTFFATEGGASDEAELLLQAYADVVTLVILQDGDLGEASVEERVRKALQGRIVVERAKGVMAYEHGLDLPAAYHRLIQVAAQRGASLTTTAAQIVESAQHPHTPTD